MEVEINMINVEDGDAFILTLKRSNGEKALVIIDGGYKRFYKERLKKRLDELLPEFNNKISLLVCTHYDDDHLSGTESLIDEYHNIISEIWLHKANSTLLNKIEELNQGIAIIEQRNSKILMEQYNPDAERLRRVLEGYKHLVEVLRKIKEKGLENKVVEATAGMKLIGFEELEVISPTAEFYNQNLDALKNDKLLLEHTQNVESRYFVKERLHVTDPRLNRELMNLINACDHLETSSLMNGVSATNMVSIVMLLSANGKKYLFTGDAGIETFEKHIPNWEDRLAELYWLDLPHHGSKNNTSRKMIEVFKPKIVFISASNKENRPSQFLNLCLQIKNSKVHISNSDSDLWYLKLNKVGTVETHVR
jgi:beta-lactamase superfamily II metal-dependent hydrolase